MMQKRKYQGDRKARLANFSFIFVRQVFTPVISGLLRREYFQYFKY